MSLLPLLVSIEAHARELPAVRRGRPDIAPASAGRPPLLHRETFDPTGRIERLTTRVFVRDR
jgi:hypothetical protein